MKKLIFVLTLFLACTFLQAQIQDPQTIEENLEMYGNFIFDDMAERTGGYLKIEPDIDIGDWSITTFLGLPSYYSFDLVRMVVSNFVNSYSDVVTVRSWRPDKHGHNYTARFGDDYLLIFYLMSEGDTLLIRLVYSP